MKIGAWVRILPNEWSMRHGWNGKMGKVMDYVPPLDPTEEGTVGIEIPGHTLPLYVYTGTVMPLQNHFQ